ncbi:MAG: hypothetical protein JWL83_1566 [Actinomycetia bacterium]|nr:hypothetical protein [Actinomycetes bacterium]
MICVIWTWCARAAWVVLPFTAGAAIADALGGWSRAPAVVAMVLLWAAWLAGLIALLAPRPWGFAILRVVAPNAFVISAIADAPGGTRVVAVVCSLVAMVFALGAPIARASANSISYGNEDRFPLSVPVPLALAPLPIAVLVIAAGVSAGPLLIADGRVIAGVIALVAGLPVAVLAANSVRALSRRWLVFVPAGLVVVDPLTLADPLLMPREDVEAIVTSAVPGALDLRLGAARGTTTFALHDHATLARRRGRANAVMLHARALRIAVVDRRTMVEVALGRRLPVGEAGSAHTAMPPPRTTSPS